MENRNADVIIVGGGIAGCVLASRLQQRNSTLKVLLIEAGLDVTDHPLVPFAETAPLLQGSELDWNYTTVPQQHLDGRTCVQNSGKALGGGSAINVCGWIRGDANDYDAWATLVGDQRWSYKGFLPYFRKTEHYHNIANLNEHGDAGPIYTQSITSSGRIYPLREQVQGAWASAGVKGISDANSGSPQGLSQLVENRRDGLRQLASVLYPLAGVQVMTNALVKLVMLQRQHNRLKAVGVELADESIYTANKMVILSAGAYRTPQILLLSGIGPAAELALHCIPQRVDAPDVGRNFHDHFSVAQLWKLRSPENGHAAGSPLWKDPAYSKGVPLDWVVTQSVPQDGLRGAIVADEGTVSDDHPLLIRPRSFMESLLVYAGASQADPIVPLDGTHVTTTVAALLPTSRGTITLASTDPHAAPLIDPNYYATEIDRYVMRTGLRKLAQVLGSPQGQAFIVNETAPDGYEPLHSKSTDEEIDARVRKSGKTLHHPGGSAAMGKVVNSSLEVIGVDALMVVDASVLPAPIAGHYQACVYALAEQAADILGEKLGMGV
ncbi:hypothetical protein MMC11_005541 [Xylographa trunciseda]|nr:hypothetical protein [Xylographa trunciseda]